jgi:hypothetical protein
MKMRLQIASMLPVPGKAEPAGSLGKGAFGATLQGMMGIPDAAHTKPAAMSLVPLSKSVQMVADVRPDRSRGPSEELAGREHGTSEETETGVPSSGSFPAQPADQRERIEAPIVPQPGAEGSTVSNQPLTGPVAQTPTIERAMIQSSIMTMPQITPKSDLIRQPGAAAEAHLTASTKGTSPQLAHKAQATHDQLHLAAAPSSGMGAPVLLVSDFVVPVTTAQLQGSHPSASQPAPNIVSSSRVRGQNQSGRVSVRSMSTSQAAPSSKSFAALGSLVLGHTGAVAGGGGETLRRPASATADRTTGSQPASPSTQKSSASVVTSAIRSVETKSPHSVPESGESAASQMDVRSVKDAVQKAGTEVKSEIVKSDIKVNLPAQSTPGPATVEHQGALNLSPANLHGTEKAIATHRPEASAAQMLQRMDMAASPGVVQLRADARRLDVGVSSATLGWVEVRATTGPSGRIDATLQTQSDVSAHVLAGQSGDISSYAREHSVLLGQVSVGVGTGGSTQGESRSNDHGSRDENATPTGDAVRTPANTEQAYQAADAVSFISVRV